MRWTRSVARALTRWTDRGLFGDFKHLLEVVVPVVLVGEDRPDVERIIFSDGSETSAAAGNFVRYAVEAQTGAVELVAFGVGRPSNPLNLLPDQLPQQTVFAAPTRPPGSQGAWSASTPAGAATVSLVRGPTNETVWLPVAGMIIPQGFEWGVRQASLNDSLFGVAFWRNVASSP